MFNKENIELIEEILEKNPRALENVNFEIFKKNILDKLGRDYTVMLSKFPNISKMVITLEEKYPEMFDIIANKVKESKSIYSNQIKNEDLITYLYRECTNIDLTKTKKQDIVNAAILSCKSKSFRDIISIKPQENYQQKLDEEYIKEYENAKDIEYKKMYILTNF